MLTEALKNGLWSFRDDVIRRYDRKINMINRYLINDSTKEAIKNFGRWVLARNRYGLEILINNVFWKLPSNRAFPYCL